MTRCLSCQRRNSVCARKRTGASREGCFISSTTLRHGSEVRHDKAESTTYDARFRLCRKDRISGHTCLERVSVYGSQIHGRFHTQNEHPAFRGPPGRIDKRRKCEACAVLVRQRKENDRPDYSIRYIKESTTDLKIRLVSWEEVRECRSEDERSID